ncbi:hypothetical protein [Gordonia spumicola]|uniref:hypothetical protein n=1 Tax=Gordonia spumicola TaxID=589161 RepID=UPI001E51C656|nr:hypothetical protein [Gordonia spumicola]
MLTLLSLIGFEFAQVDVHVGDSGAGLLSVVTPFLTGFGLLAGGLLTFGHTSTLIALAAGIATGVVLSGVALLILGYLVDSEEELPSFDLIGSTVRIVEPVSDGRLGTAEVSTPLGTRQITVRSTEQLPHNARAVVLEKADGREVFIVSPITFGDHPEGN